MKGIPLTPHEVKGLLSGSITKLAREIKPQPVVCPLNPLYLDWKDSTYSRDAAFTRECPFQPGEVRWVKEAWMEVAHWNTLEPTGQFLYRATHEGREPTLVDGDGFKVWRKDGREASPWRYSTVMPKAASRLNIKFGPTRAVMLGDLTDEEIYWLGFPEAFRYCIDGQPWIGMGKAELPRINAFKDYWNSTHKQKWEGSRWIWLTDVEVIR